MALSGDTCRPWAPKAPHFPAKAKRVIYLFMAGGPSHLDLFDPKPELTRQNGKPLPASSVVGAPDPEIGARVVGLVGTREFRLYRNRDLIGVELCGALHVTVASPKVTPYQSRIHGPNFQLARPAPRSRPPTRQSRPTA